MKVVTGTAWVKTGSEPGKHQLQFLGPVTLASQL